MQASIFMTAMELARSMGTEEDLAFIDSMTGNGLKSALDRSMDPDAPPQHPVDALRATAFAGWGISADESIDSSHPICAMAFLARAQEIERLGFDAEIERMAMTLAHAMAGLRGPDGLDPHWAAGIEGSLWGRSQCPRITELARSLSTALIEAREIGAATPASPSLASGAAPRAPRI